MTKSVTSFFLNNMATTSSLPAVPAAASKAALDSAITETNAKESSDGAADQSTTTANGTENPDDSIRTVFTDPENFNVKHPLYHKWTLWFDNPSAKGLNAKTPGGKDSWGEDLNKVVDFDSVEEFWGLFQNIITPSELPQKANYYLFKDGIKPAWEDPANTNGGKWSIQLPRDKSKPFIDNLWLYTMLAAIGETLESQVSGESSDPNPDLVTGVIMSARQSFYRIAIWTRKAEDPVEESAPGSIGKQLLDIGHHFKTQILGYELHQKVSHAGGLTSEVEFQSHKESEKKKGKKFVI